MVAVNENNDIKKKLLGFINIAEQGKRDLLTRAANGDNLYKGNHFTAEELELYEKKKVTPITVNHCFPIINTMSGMQRQSRRDVKVRHRKGSSSAIAGVYTELIKHTFDMSYAHFITSLTYKRGTVTGEDWIKATVEDDGSDGGAIQIGRVSVFNAFPDPTCINYDINQGGRFFIEREWINREEIEAKYPDCKEKLQSPGIYEMSGDSYLDEIMGYFYGEEDNGDDDDGLKKFRYQVFTFWWKEIVPAVRWRDKKLGTSKLLFKKKDIARAKQVTKADGKRYSVATTTKNILHKSQMVGSVLLGDEANPLGEKIDFLPFIRFAPYFEDGYSFGALENLQGPQREENISRTQATRILNQTANSGWKIKKAVKKAKLAILQMFGSTPGIVLEEDDFGGKVEKIEPNQLSTGHVALGERASRDMVEISSVNKEMQGVDGGRAESGRALAIKQRQGQTATEPVMDNLDWTLKILGAMLIEYIRNTDVYSDDEIKAIIDQSKLIDLDAMAAAEERFAVSPKVEEPNAQLMAIMRPEHKQAIMQAGQRYEQKIGDRWGEVVRLEAVDMFLEKIRTDEKGTYGIKVDLSPEAPTIKLANLIELSEIAEKYPGQIPMSVFIKNSGLTNKDEIEEEIERYNQMNMAMRGPAMQGAA